MADPARAPQCLVQRQGKYSEISAWSRLCIKVYEDLEFLESALQLISYRTQNEGKLNISTRALLGRAYNLIYYQ